MERISPVDDGPSATSDVAKRMGETIDYANVYRAKLLDARVIVALRRGQVDFAVPMLRDYLRTHESGR
ncbi:hypothetical protein [Bifidobacterium samirii]|uniref:ATPase AAA n=1 Tax=Bifidobacterium samirii TaxID=2306974 RepID=A0A430FP58_9BIFI|nr:hypothetical protein [Bifidobacterium samirii]RSX54611.1 ATPase AAA [Bifidobacterium samirii]